jgi:dyslexia susceptibility 1 candidate gene 1 protein
MFFITSKTFQKVSYPPFLFECWFRENVKDEECLAIVKNGVISLKFNKLKENIWSDLFHLDFQNKELLKKVRENAIVLVGERAEKLIRQKADDIIANKKLALQQQMKVI